jgi:hypothetical protein
MARHDQRRQKKLEAKRTKRREQLRNVARRNSATVGERMLTGCRWPITESRISDTLWEKGMGYAVLVRRGHDGMSAMALFLLDVYCLGVKDVLMRLEPDHEISALLQHLGRNASGWINVSPEHVRKVVEQSVGYALNLGLSPHRDCAAAMRLFGDIDASQCSIEFVFGRDGKPLYVSGPNDSIARSRAIVETLQKTCGPDGFHYIIRADNPDALGLDGDEWDDAEQGGIEDADESDLR